MTDNLTTKDSDGRENQPLTRNCRQVALTRLVGNFVYVFLLS